MPGFYPFKALRPTNEHIAKVAAKSTDFSSKKELAKSLQKDSLSFHNVTKNHLNYSGAYQEPEKFLPFAAKFLEDLIRNEILVDDTQEAYYIYTQKKPSGKVFSGIIGLVDVEDYNNNTLRKHEEIRPNKVKFVSELLRSTKVMGEAVLIASEFPEKIDYNNSEELVEFGSVDGKIHKIARVTDPSLIKQYKEMFTKIPVFYIADGHHRCASVAHYNNKYPSEGNSQIMCILMDEDDLEISAFHRLIRNINHISEEDFFMKLRSTFEVVESDESMYEPQANGEFGMYKGGVWYKLTYKGDPGDILDVDLLEEAVVRSIFKIEDSSTDSQISFKSAFEGRDNIVRLIDNDTFRAAFTLKPCDFKDIRGVADKHNVMPPKSTYIDPKLRAGMVIKKF